MSVSTHDPSTLFSHGSVDEAASEVVTGVALEAATSVASKSLPEVLQMPPPPTA